MSRNVALAVTAWATRGLHLGEKVVYIEAPDEVPARALLGLLDAQQALVDDAVVRGQLEVLGADRDVFSPQGLADVVERALQQGYPCVRISGEAATAQALVSAQSQEELERATDLLCHTQPVSVMCQYPEELVGEALAVVSGMHRDGIRQSLLRTARRPGGVVVAGEVDISNHDVLRSALQAASADGDFFVVDLSALTFLDVSGARALLAGTTVPPTRRRPGPAQRRGAAGPAGAAGVRRGGRRGAGGGRLVTISVGACRSRDGFSHDLLLHDGESAVVPGTLAFVQEGLASGGEVLVHGTEDRVAMLREILGTHPRLTYGLDQDLYQSPMATLFRYQQALAESRQPAGLWATGTVPLHGDGETQAAWARYESLVNEALSPYAFHGLCTYDTRALPERVIAAAKATHPHVDIQGRPSPSRAYQQPAAFLADPLACAPDPPAVEPTMSLQVSSPRTCGERGTSSAGASGSAAWTPSVAEDLVMATNEVLSNALQHGAPPVRLELWAAPFWLTCRVTDHGPGLSDRLRGYRHACAPGPMGLRVARQLCGELVIGDRPGGGCSVVLVTP